MQSFIKWVGGKQNLAKQAFQIVPKHYTYYYEPFVGAGSMFFKLQPSQARLSDMNERLILAYMGLRDDFPGVIQQLVSYFNTKDKEATYYKARERFNHTFTPTMVASSFIFCNLHGFNGYYRTNSKEEFNVPYNKQNTATFIPSRYLNCSAALQGIELANASFRAVPIVANAFYYFDPPYRNTLQDYNKEGFFDHDFEDLKSLCDDINNKGSKFMFSHNDDSFIRNLFGEYNLGEIEFNRTYDASRESITDKIVGQTNSKVKELLITNYTRNQRTLAI